MDGSEVSRFHPHASTAPAEVHGPGAGMLGCQQPLLAMRAQFPACVCPYGRPGDPATPTRSARTPLVVRPLQCRPETPTLPDATGGFPPNRREPVPGCDPEPVSRGRATPSRSHHASPTPAKGRSLRTQKRHAWTSEPANEPTRGRTTLAHGHAGTTYPGQGPHHPPLREEEQDPPHPRCLPSVRPAGHVEETPTLPAQLDLGETPRPFCRSPGTRTGPFRSSHPADRW